MLKIRSVAAILAFLVSAALPVSAQEYPTREIRAICPFVAGTGADVIGRYYGQKLSEILGKSVITENRPGAQGLLGTEQLIRAKNDGYTISFNPASSTLAAAPHLFKSLSFDPMKDVEMAGMMLSTSFILIVSPSSGINSVADLTKRLKEKKGDSFYVGSTNAGIVASEIYKKAIGVDVKRVNYRNAADATNELISGKMDFFFTDATSALGHIAGGRYKPLAISSAKRSEAFPDLPTMTELGYPMDLAPWWGLIVPAGTPKPVVDKLAAAVNKINDLPETKTFLRNAGLDPVRGDAAEMRKRLVEDDVRWKEWVSMANIEIQQ